MRTGTINQVERKYDRVVGVEPERPKGGTHLMAQRNHEGPMPQAL